MSNQQNQVSLATSLVNGAQQTVNNYCSISCNADISNVNILIEGGNATIKIGQTCTNIGSECTIKNLVSTEIENMIENLIQQQQTNGGIFSLLGPSQSNNANISNSIKNQISQLINNTCNQNTNVTLNNMNITSIDANLNFNYVQTGTQDHATCALDTVAKLVLNNQVSNSVKQTQSSCGNVLGILIAIAVIIVLIIVGYIIFKVVGKKKGGGEADSGEAGPKEEVVINEGGLPPGIPQDVIQDYKNKMNSLNPDQRAAAMDAINKGDLKTFSNILGMNPPPPQPGFYDRFKSNVSNTYNNATSGISNAYQATKNFFTRSPTKTLQKSGLNDIQVPTETPVQAALDPYHKTSLSVGKMLYIKKNVPGFTDAITGIPSGTTSCSDGGVNMKCPPNTAVDRALNRVFDQYYAKK